MNDLEKRQFAIAFEKACSLFGNESDAYGWMSEPSILLGNVTPMSLLAAEEGLDLVLYEFNAMEYSLPV